MGDTFTLGFKDKILYESQTRQTLFHASQVDELLFGGMAGGGKSQAIVADAAGNACAFAGLNVGVFRRTFPELNRSIVKKFRSTMQTGTYKYNKSEHVFSFPNGSTIELNYCENEDDVYNYQSAEYDILYFDELTHFTKFQYTYLLSRLRNTRKDFTPKAKSASNPGNIGNTWVKERFITVGKPEEVITQHDEESGRVFSTMFIPSSVYENKYIMDNDPQYIQRLLGLPEKERRALLMGDWDAFTGQAFQELRRDKHIVDSFDIPQGWNMFGAFDYGFNHPYSFGIFAVNGDGVTYLIKRIKGRLKRVDEIARSIIDAVEPYGGIKRFSYTVAGTDCWNIRKERTEPSIYEQFLNFSTPIVLQKAATARAQGVAQMRSFFAWKGTSQDDDGPVDGKPRFYFFQDTSEVFTVVSGMIFDPNDSEDVLKVDADEDGKGGDDDYDMCVKKGTMIATSIGDVPIELVNIGDRVLTREGYRKVTQSGMTNPKAKVYKVTFSNGSALTGTANHPIYVKGKGFMRIDILQYGDPLSAVTNGVSAVHVVDISPAGIDSVYNLTVDKTPEYYANGVLVHNCRYALMSRPRPLSQRIIKPPARSFEGIMRKKREERLLSNEYVGY